MTENIIILNCTLNWAIEGKHSPQPQGFCDIKIFLRNIFFFFSFNSDTFLHRTILYIPKEWKSTTKKNSFCFWSRQMVEFFKSSIHTAIYFCSSFFTYFFFLKSEVSWETSLTHTSTYTVCYYSEIKPNNNFLCGRRVKLKEIQKKVSHIIKNEIDSFFLHHCMLKKNPSFLLILYVVPKYTYRNRSLSNDHNYLRINK